MAFFYKILLISLDVCQIHTWIDHFNWISTNFYWISPTFDAGARSMEVGVNEDQKKNISRTD